MEQKEKYQLSINKENKLSKLRSEILSLESEKALDALLDSQFPASLIQSFPEQDLYFLMHHIGRDDFLPVLSLASSSQWEYILDLEVWNNDRLDLNKMTHNFELLYNADPQRFLRWTIKEKTEFIEYYLFKNMEIVIREHDQDPSDFQDALKDIENDFTTIDSIFYFRFPKNEHLEKLSEESRENLITSMLNTLADMDISIFHALLLETRTIIPAETEEEEFRLRNIRLEEKGFLPPHEAAAVYQPLKIDDLKKRLSIFFEKSFIESELPKPPLSLSLIVQTSSALYKHNSKTNYKNIFAASLEFLESLSHKKNESSFNKLFDIILNMQSELAFLVNSIVSADKKNVRSKEELEKIVQKTCSYLNLGMEIINFEIKSSSTNSSNNIGSTPQKGTSIICGNESTPQKGASIICGDELTPQKGASIICEYALKDIFRVGSGAVIKLKESAKKWYVKSYIARNSLSLNFLGEKQLGVIGGLLLDFPLFFNCLESVEYEPLYRPFVSVEDITKSRQELNLIIEIDKAVEQLNLNINFDVKLFSKQFVTWKSLFLTLWAMNRMNLDKNSGYFIPLNKFKPFFIQMLNLKSIKKIVSDNENERSDGYGKINPIVREDFFNWLNVSSVISDTARIIFEALFDELEQEYGKVSQEDVDPKFIYHFVVK